ncbi:MAG: hypothetical protein AAGF11_49845 [Myxococcota bacterium]
MEDFARPSSGSSPRDANNHRRHRAVAVAFPNVTGLHHEAAIIENLPRSTPTNRSDLVLAASIDQSIHSCVVVRRALSIAVDHHRVSGASLNSPPRLGRY